MSILRESFSLKTFTKAWMNNNILLLQYKGHCLTLIAFPLLVFCYLSATSSHDRSGSGATKLVRTDRKEVSVKLQRNCHDKS